MKTTTIIAALIFLAACSKTGTPVEVAGALDDFSVTRLFERDGCKVYRFFDRGSVHYFTSCPGETETEQGCGKNCTYKENIQTGTGN